MLNNRLGKNSAPHSHPRSRHLIRSLKARLDPHRTWGEKVADFLTAKLGSMAFLLLNLAIFVFWIYFNAGFFPGVAPVDPFPFHFLTFVVSLEAICLAVVVLISQNRAAKIEDLREEVDLQVDIIAETELTEVLRLLVQLLHQQNISIPNEAEVTKMLLPLDTQKIEKVLVNEVRQDA